MPAGPRILVSACLLGQPVRYDGSAKTLLHPLLQHWQQNGWVVSLCPERAGGMPTPRPAAEIANGLSGRDVVAGQALVRDTTGADVTAPFLDGAQAALALAQQEGCTVALLIDGSPSCGSLTIYDGSFTGQKQAGEGVTAALLRQNGIAVFAPADIEKLAASLSSF
ncbi:DUF523 domain-containing protein [Acetobacter cibinongensis]|uniref:Uncharacterized protein n=1 Tax=Acetobacter cibinongensis TaxID=146475 RepID=A0A1Z5YZ87_9PROT|nr:DUF523 domain-containing protein [Acetobacter cibinongensis]OUJ04678.1 hypothetical protein HK14_00625 [Acetobacter cibinongensis]